MIEKRFTQEEHPYFSSVEYHVDRVAAHHLEEPEHRPRLLKVKEIINSLGTKVSSVVDFGCGDGGLISELFGYIAWGYDFCPDNVKYATEIRHVNVQYANCVEELDMIKTNADICIATEYLEHLENPHKFLEDILNKTKIKYLVCSSPWNETNLEIAGGHVWAWDREGYQALVENAGWEIILHEDVEPRFQIILAKRK